MRIVPLLLGLLLGTLPVAQNVLNRQIGESWGLSSAILLHGAVLTLAAAAALLFVRSQPQLFPSLFHGTPSVQTFQWWYLLPGFLGCVFITGVPWAISKLGVGQVFVMVVAGQMAASLGYDVLFEGRPLSVARVGGALLALGGAILFSLDASGR